MAAVVEHEGRFLLVEEHTAAGRLVFNQPAGHVEYGESLLEAVARETLEETAWRFTPQALVGIYLWNRPAGQAGYLRVCFAGSVDAHDPEQALDEGIERAVWRSRQELLADEERLRSPLVLQVIDDYLAGERYPLSVLKFLLA
ncbi:NUDIX hydrolase [Methylococcus sp. EFPC2]|uniref:NUDIX hydrolase n=1 Tax=Methylococcus sp. EFPC2 TaxID=2812648 RepID=UPI00353050D7